MQLYSVAFDIMGDLEEGFRQVRAAGFTTVELPMMFGRSAKEMRVMLDAADLRCRSVHYFGFATPSALPGTLNLSSDCERIRDELGVLGASHAVLGLHLLPQGTEFGTDPMSALKSAASRMRVADWSATADLLNESGALLAASGFRVAYHNHSREFAPIEGTRGFDVLLAQTAPELVDFEFDVGWAACAGEDPCELIRKARKRIRLLHIKDCGRTCPPSYDFQMNPVPMGKGKVDWQQVFSCCDDLGPNAIFIENEPMEDMTGFEAARQGLRYISEL